MVLHHMFAFSVLVHDPNELPFRRVSEDLLDVLDPGRETGTLEQFLRLPMGELPALLHVFEDALRLRRGGLRVVVQIDLCHGTIG